MYTGYISGSYGPKIKKINTVENAVIFRQYPGITSMNAEVSWSLNLTIT